MKDVRDIYMHTASGVRFYPFNPMPEQVNIETVAQHLSCTARWSGATRHKTFKDRIFYSVAEHSVYCAQYVFLELGRPDLYMQALLHDATESYVPDLIRPLKYSPAFHEPFADLEDSIQEVVSKKFGLPLKMDPLVKTADNAVCRAEFEQIVCIGNSTAQSDDPIINGEGEVAAKVDIKMLSPNKAMELFLRAYEYGQFCKDRLEPAHV